jgi:L,D-transpeptidase ErfK/SrfK
VIGSIGTYVTREEDTLLDIARENGVGYVEMRAANPGIDPWLPGAGRTVILPTAHVLPQAPREGIVINLGELRLYWFRPKRAREEPEVRSFPLGIGREGKETPVGRTKIVRKTANPVWIPTRSEHEEDPELPDRVPPGPDNPMGDYALYLGWRGYAIHGTNKPYSIGRRDSHGCIRMLPEDAEALFNLAPVGTPVTVVDQSVKVGWWHGDLFLEIHPIQADAEEMEEHGRSSTPLLGEAEALVLKIAGKEAHRVDWYAVGETALRRTGVPRQITFRR